MRQRWDETFSYILCLINTLFCFFKKNMAWTQKTIFKVEEPSEDPQTDENEEARLRDMFRNMPPFIKISSRRAREALVKYEAHKQRYIETLRNNPVYKFVMQVAAFTNEDMEKYWRGKTLAPFMEEHMPQDIKIEKEDVELLVSRAREHAFADLHQFCRPIDAIPVYRPSVIFPKKKDITFWNLKNNPTTVERSRLFTLIDEGDQKAKISLKSEDLDVLSGLERPEMTLFDYKFLINGIEYIIDKYIGANDNKLYVTLKSKKGSKSIAITADDLDITDPKYIYNMSGAEFFQFYKKFLSEKQYYTKNDVYDRTMGRNRIGRYVLGSKTVQESFEREYPAHDFNYNFVKKRREDDNNEILRLAKRVQNTKDAKEYMDTLKQAIIRDRKEIEELEIWKIPDVKFRIEQLLMKEMERDIDQEDNDMDIDYDEKFEMLSANAKEELNVLLNRIPVLTRMIKQAEERIKQANDSARNAEGGESKGADPMDIDTDSFEFKKLFRMLSASGVYDHTAIFKKGKRRRDEEGKRDYDMYDTHEYSSLNVENAITWGDNFPIVRWEDKRPEFWFQRYIARFLTNDPKGGTNTIDDFQSKYRRLFNNLRYENGRWIRDLTGLRLSRMLRGPKEKKSKTRVVKGNISDEEGRKTTDTFYSYDAEENEGDQTDKRPCEVPCEVPLDFVEPLFNERFAYWKHNLVLGEYEKRSQYQADLWLQKTPWAIGKLYLMPAIVGHMTEAHVAITSNFSNYKNVELMDILNSERHSFFFSKLVALCIRTSAVLSGKKYGLDKAYMRLNLEKRRIMYSFKKVGPPSRSSRRSQRPVEYSSSTVTRRNRREFEEAKRRGDEGAMRSILLGNY